jgi:hypothetical protein
MSGSGDRSHEQHLAKTSNRSVLAATGRPVVNATTLLPVFMPMAPAATVLQRFPDTLAGIMRAHGIADHLIAARSARRVAIGQVGQERADRITVEISELRGPGVVEECGQAVAVGA